MPKFERRNLEIDEISVCEEGANEGAKIFFFKSNKENVMDVEKIEDKELKKEVEDFIKEQEDKSQELQKQFDELQEKHNELVKAQEEKDKEDEPIEKKVDELPEGMKKAWEDSQETIKKAQEDAASAKEEVAELRKEALQKEMASIVDEMPRLAASPEEHKALTDLLMKMDTEDRKSYLESLQKAEKIAGEAESMFKEIGHPNALCHMFFG